MLTGVFSSLAAQHLKKPERPEKKLLVYDENQKNNIKLAYASLSIIRIKFRQKFFSINDNMRPLRLKVFFKGNSFNTGKQKDQFYVDRSDQKTLKHREKQFNLLFTIVEEVRIHSTNVFQIQHLLLTNVNQMALERPPRGHKRSNLAKYTCFLQEPALESKLFDPGCTIATGGLIHVFLSALKAVYVIGHHDILEN